MTQQYTPVTWQDETTSQQGTLINAERLNQMQTAHHYADGFEEVDAVPAADPSVAYHKVVYCTADSTFYRWDGTEWTKDIDDETKALLQQEIARATEAEGELAQDLADETTARETADSAMQADITAMQSGKLDKKTASPNQYQVYGVRGSNQIMINAGFSAHAVPLYGVEDELLAKMPTISLTENTVVNYGWATAQIGAEATARTEADTLLGDRITAETTAREGADTALGNRITAEETRATQAEQANAQAIATHVADRQNPHEVTKAQVGLGNVDNTSDLDKPISTSTQSALDTKVGISEGVTPWSATVTYSANAFCAVNGTLYRSLSAGNLGHNPLSSADWWEEYSSGSKQSTGLIGPDNLYTADIGDGTSTVLAVNHGLTSFDILWAIWDGTNKAVTGVKAVKTSADILTLTFAEAPAVGQYRILVFRPGDSARIYTRTFAPTSNEVVIIHNLGRLPSGISLYAPDGTRVGVRMTVDTMTATLHLAGYDAGNYTIQVIA